MARGGVEAGAGGERVVAGDEELDRVGSSALRRVGGEREHERAVGLEDALDGVDGVGAVAADLAMVLGALDGDDVAGGARGRERVVEARGERRRASAARTRRRR